MGALICGAHLPLLLVKASEFWENPSKKVGLPCLAFIMTYNWTFLAIHKREKTQAEYPLPEI